jgi:hypothetical protein
MSCFVVPDYHVSALVAWAIRQDLVLDLSPDALAHELASANRRAYSERYAGRFDSELLPFAGLDRSAGAELLPVAVVKACDCLRYQASDWSGWSASAACDHLAAIQSAALCEAYGARSVPDTDARALPGYDDAPWVLDEPDLAAERDRRLAALDYPEHELAAIRAALAATRCAA